MEKSEDSNSVLKSQTVPPPRLTRLSKLESPMAAASSAAAPS